MQKNLNIEKITFKVVQMKFLAMHITNQKLSFDMKSSFAKTDNSVFNNRVFSLCIPINLNQTAVGLV